MHIVYKSNKIFRQGSESEFRDFPRLSPSEEWYVGIDGSTTSYGLSIYTMDYSEVHLFIFCREGFETAESFREVLYDWLRNYLYGIPIQGLTYEKTPEGYKPPSSHAEKVMRDTETAIKNFVSDRNYIYIKNKEHIFDIFPNAWKSFSVPKDRENLGKVDKELNAIAVLESCGLNVQYWLKEISLLTKKHDFDCFEALGVGRFGSHFILTDEGHVRVYKNFTKVGTQLVVAKRINMNEGLGPEIPFVGSFGKGRSIRFCSLNETHSLPENFMGLYDKEFNNILFVENEHPFSIYIDSAFGFDTDDTRDYLILASKSSKTDLGVEVCREHGYTPIYI